MANIDWDRVRQGVERERFRMVWKPFGFPEIVDPTGSAFVTESREKPWDIPEGIIVSTAVTGAFFSERANPSQPITPKEILDEAMTCAAAGSSTVHIHVRDDRGYNVLSYDRFMQVVEPLREAYPEIALDGCLVPALEGEWNEMVKVLDAGLFDAVPVNPTATYMGDSLFAKPVPLLLEKTRLVLEAGAKPIIACYTDGDVNNAERYLINSELIDLPAYWIILPALDGCSPMGNPRQMVEGLMRMSNLIRDVDSEAVILVCAAGRASTYLVTVAAALGLHIRVGMEDTVWRWPHKDDRIESNLQMLEMAKSLVAGLGRYVLDFTQYREFLKLPPR